MPLNSNCSKSYRDGTHRDPREYDVSLTSSSRARSHRHRQRGPAQRGETAAAARSRTHRQQQRQQQQHQQKYDDLAHVDLLLDDILDDKKERRRRTKRSSSGHQQHDELFMFIRVFVSVILMTAMLCIAAGFLFGLLYKLSTYASSLSLGGNDGTIGLLGSDFVKNVDEIKHILQVAQTTRYNQKATDKSSFTVISHPGNPSIHISVPEFYAATTISNGDSPPTTKLLREYTSGKLLTPELASIVGSSKSSSTEMDQSQRTIFVSILSNNDPLCSVTISNILSTASHPDRIHIAVVDKTNTESPDYVPCDDVKSCDLDPDQIICQLRDNFDVYELESDLDAGAIFKRNIANRMYSGEYYALQVGHDSAIVFSRGWDDDLIEQFEATSNEMAILTTYVSAAKIYRTEMNDDVEARRERYTVCHASFEGVRPNRHLMHLRKNQLEQVQSLTRRNPQLQPYWSSEFSFSRGHFILNVPYDPHICGLDEQEEDISMTLRAFTHGYDFYTPTNSVIFRYPNDGKRLMGLDSKPKECGADTIVKSRHRLEKHLVEDERPDVFGLGSVRSPSKFFSCFGIHMNERVTEHRMCEFVTSGNLHDEFTPHLRSNGMGIDYTDIKFRFHELISIHKESEHMS